MIPLVRPLMPKLDFVDKLSVCQEAGVWSNFGPLFKRTVEALKFATKGRHCLPVTNGTVAIEVALKTILKPGARVLVPDFTHAGTILAVVAAGCVPVLAPCNERTWTLDIQTLYTNADSYDLMLVVSPFGYRVNFLSYDTAAKELGKAIVYDLAGAWGMFPETDWPCCYSFHATKNFCVGEGGMISYPDLIQWEEGRVLTNFQTLPDRSIGGWRGGNYKVDEVKCAMILSQLERLDEIKEKIENKKRSIDLYQKLIPNCVPHSLFDHGHPSLCVLGGITRAKEIEKMSEALGVVTKTYYPLLSRMRSLKQVEKVAVSGPFFESCLALPSDVSIPEIEKVAEVVRMIQDGKFGA